MTPRYLPACGIGFLLGTTAVAIYQVVSFGRVMPGSVIILLLFLMVAAMSKAISLRL